MNYGKKELENDFQTALATPLLSRLTMSTSPQNALAQRGKPQSKQSKVMSTPLYNINSDHLRFNRKYFEKSKIPESKRRKHRKRQRQRRRERKQNAKENAKLSESTSIDTTDSPTVLIKTSEDDSKSSKDDFKSDSKSDDSVSDSSTSDEDTSSSNQDSSIFNVSNAKGAKRKSKKSKNHKKNKKSKARKKRRSNAKGAKWKSKKSKNHQKNKKSKAHKKRRRQRKRPRKYNLSKAMQFPLHTTKYRFYGVTNPFCNVLLPFSDSCIDGITYFPIREATKCILLN